MSTDDRPTHLNIRAGDKRSACGLKRALPCCTVQAAPMHIEGWGMKVCEECATVVVRALLVGRDGAPAYTEHIGVQLRALLEVAS